MRTSFFTSALLSFFLFPFFTYAQSTGIIRGTVFESATGEPLYGATVVIQGTTNGSITDFDGKFEINAEAGMYNLVYSFVSLRTIVINDVEVKAGEVTVINGVQMEDDVEQLEAVEVTANVINTSETAMLLVKKKSANVIDGISAESFRKIGDSNVGEAARRVTGVSVEGGKYVYVRGLGDRYTKTTLNGLDIPGLDPDRNSIQIDIFPTNLIDNLVILKSFTADLPADFTGGIVNIETKDFPEQRVLEASASVTYVPGQHFSNDFLTYEGGSTDWLGYDDGTRALPDAARTLDVPSPLNGSSDQEISSFLGEFGPDMGVDRGSNLLNASFSFTAADQKQFENGNNIGYMLSANYNASSLIYDQSFFGEFQNDIDADVDEFQRAVTLDGTLAEQNVLLGGLAGVAFKTDKSKYKFNILKLQNGQSRAGEFDVIDDDGAVGKSGYTGITDNLEYNQRSVTNTFLNGEHFFSEGKYEIDWRGSATFSTQEDPDIRKTPYTDLTGDRFAFAAGANGNPQRLWRELEEVNYAGKIDFTMKHSLFSRDAKFKAGVSHVYKERDYRILQLNTLFFGSQPTWTGDANEVWTDQTLFPNGTLYQVSGNSNPNSNEYNSNINNTGVYVQSEFSLSEKLKSIIGLRGENFVQRHTGRDQQLTRVLENEKVLDAFDLFPSANFIYSLTEQQNLRVSYSRTIARPSFKELSFAQILDPVSNRFFDGGLFAIDDWDGNLKETRINNADLRWEMYLERGQLLSASAFYKQFDSPIELVRLPQAQTTAEFQPRNVGNGQLLGVEFEFRNSLDFLSQRLTNFSVNGNLTLVESIINISPTELRNRENNARTDQVIEGTRRMAGQAPFIINAGLQYDRRESGLEAGFFYNVKGPTLVVVGGGIDPDVFSEPFHSFNFNMNKRFGSEQQATFNFSVANIFNDLREEFYQREGATEQLFTRFNPGTQISLGLSYSF